MIKKKESVFRLILEGNILAQLQVDKDLKNLLMLFCIIIGQEWGPVVFFFYLLSNVFCHSIWIQVHNYDKVLYFSHSKVEPLYLFKRHMSDFFNIIFLKDFSAYSVLQKQACVFIVISLCILHSNGGVIKRIFFNWPLCVSVSAFLLHHLLLVSILQAELHPLAQKNA